MKVIEQFGHQGDTQWFVIDEIPQDAAPIKKSPLAESVNGTSAHILCGNYEMYSYKNGFCIKVLEDSTLNHYAGKYDEIMLNTNTVLPYKDHKSATIPANTYYVGIQRRFNPFLKLWTNVID